MPPLRQHRRLFILVAIALTLLLVPAMAMSLTTEVTWSLSDFAAAGGLLVALALIIEWILRSVDRPLFRLLFIVLILLMAGFVWAELAVGIVGSPWAGS